MELAFDAFINTIEGKVQTMETVTNFDFKFFRKHTGSLPKNSDY